jgi:hypothetical protein
MIDTELMDDCLSGIDFPADVHSVTEGAERNGCPRSVVSQLQSSPSRTYSSRDELLCRLGDPSSCFLEA